MINLKDKIKIAHIVQALSLLVILFLIFFSQFSKKTEINFNTNTESTNFEEQTLYPEGVPVEPDNESGAQANAQGNEESTTNESESADINTTENSDAPAEAPKKEALRADLTIGIIADAHSGQGYGFARLGSASWSLKNYFAPDIAINLGDLIESRFHYKNIKKSAAVADYKSASYLISRYFPTYHAIGNHEVMSLSKADIQNLTGRKNYYAVKIKGYNVIILDANYTEDEDNIDAKHADDFLYDGTLPENELEWLEDQVEKNNNNIIFVHHPLRELTNRNEVEEVIRDNKQRIIMIANGHKHPKTLGTSTFGGVKNYEIPSTQFQKAYAVIRINGAQATVISRKFMN